MASNIIKSLNFCHIYHCPPSMSHYDLSKGKPWVLSSLFSWNFLYVVDTIAEYIAHIQTFHCLHALTEAWTYTISIGSLPPSLYLAITAPNTHSVFHWTLQVARHVLVPGGTLYFQVLNLKVPVSWVQLSQMLAWPLVEHFAACPFSSCLPTPPALILSLELTIT